MARIDRKSLSRLYAWLRHIKTWQLVIILVIMLAASASLLRMNNLHMGDLREAVMAADMANDRTKLQSSLVELQRYVSSHMNTSLGNGIYLEHSYNRDRDAALATATSTTNPKSAMYQQASVECRARFVNTGVVYSNEYVACVVDRLKALGGSESDQTGLALPLASNYHYNFASPFFSFDLAGLGVALCGLIVSVIVLRALTAAMLRFILRRKFKAL